VENMNVGIDIRPLLEHKRSGVGEYVYQLLNAVFDADKENQYFLFYNSFKKVDDLLPKEWKSLSNVYFCGFSWPNKFFNFCLKFFGWPKVDRLMSSRGAKRRSNPMGSDMNEIAAPRQVGARNDKLDTFFIPNLNFIALSRGVKKFITVHDLSFERYPPFFSWKRRLWHWFVNPRRLIRGCDKIIAVSENTKRDLVELYKVTAEKIKVVYSGVRQESGIMNQESEIEEVKKKYNLPENFILFLGTLEPRKNIEGLVRAFEILKENYQLPITNYRLLIVGPKGWMYKKILARAAKSPFRGDIRFVSYIDPEEKFAFYKAAKIFIYPSFYEGFGFPPLEAAAAGTPVIASTASSLPEIMGEAALMVDPYNPAEMAKAMAECLTDENLRAILVEKGKKQAEKFSWGKCVEETIKILLQ
jgi:glycosyltransferase involved in cell wall biosynthesis